MGQDVWVPCQSFGCIGGFHIEGDDRLSGRPARCEACGAVHVWMGQWIVSRSDAW